MFDGTHHFGGCLRTNAFQFITFQPPNTVFGANGSVEAHDLIIDDTKDCFILTT